MSKSSPVGFREVLVDQHFMGKWMDVDMNLGGGHTTFQGTKFSDFAGGFSYRTANNGNISKAGSSVVQNRCIYWRTLNDTLELTEISMNYNLVDNQVRYIFQDSPIVGPVAIQETENSVIILVATVTSVNRFVFTHPKRIEEMQGDKVPLGNIRPSIFYQVCNQPQMNFKSFNLYENAINISVPLCAACQYVDRGAQLGECVFAFSFENGKIHVYKVSREDALTLHDLKQSNLFAKISGFASQFLKGPSSTTDAVIGMNFFTTRAGKTIQLVTLGMNGTLNLWHCPSLDTFNEWLIKPFGLVDEKFAVDATTDSSMLLRISQEPKQLPKICVYIPPVGFKFFQVVKNTEAAFSKSSNISHSPYALVEHDLINFRGQELIDFSLTSDFLFILVSSAAEEAEWEDWEVKYCQLKCEVAWQSYKTFNKAVLEDIPDTDVEVYPTSMDAKEFYMDLIFNKCSFSAGTIIQALRMFKKEGDEEIKDKDWESLKITAMNIIYREIQIETSHTDFGLADDEFAELSLKLWLQFYNSCVEYHVHTVKPLGLFFEASTKMLCIVKKCRISFLRPTSLQETMYHFPQFFGSDIPSRHTDEQEFQNLMLTKYMNLIKMVEDLLIEIYARKIEKHLRGDHDRVFDVCRDIVSLIVDNDPSCLDGQRRKIVPELIKRVRELGTYGSSAMKIMILSLHSWETESSAFGEAMDGEGDDEEEEGGTTISYVSDKFMGSRIGSHLAFKCLKQLLDFRFMVARDTLLLQELLNCLLGPWIIGHEEKSLQFDEDDKFAALTATLNCFAWRQLANEAMVPVQPFVKDRGLKVSNILKIFTGDLLKSNDNSYMDNWPTKTIEAFLMSQLGGYAARARVSGERSKLCVLAFAEATGRVLWEINEEKSRNRPFEDFLISSCQYTTLLRYAAYMRDYFTFAKYPSKRFYTGLAHLCMDRVELSMAFFTKVLSLDLETDICFVHKLLESSLNNGGDASSDSTCGSSPRLEYYIKVISIFQVFEISSCVKRLAEDAFRVALLEGNEGGATQMCSLAFKNSLSLEDYKGAYSLVLRMPSYEETDGGKRRERKEKLASLRMLISSLVHKKELDVLLSLNFNGTFNETETVRDQVENILVAQANLSDPLCKDGAYQMLYLYYLKRGNFHKAADIMYHRAMRIGEKGSGLEGLEAQKEAYLDALTCLEIVPDDSLKYVVQRTGIPQEQQQEPQKSHSNKATDKESAGPTKETLVTRRINEVDIELQLIVLMVKLAKRNLIIPNPVKILSFEPEAHKTTECLAANHYYDDAIKLAQLWGIELAPIVSMFANVCTNLVNDVLPDNEDPFDYVRYNDLSELTVCEGGVVDISFRLLRKYTETLEAPAESTIHKEVTLKLLAAGIELPQWLLSSYKKKNTCQLLQCFMKYGVWGECTKLVLQLLEATLGRRDCSEFDKTIIKISAFEHTEPAIPFDEINVLVTNLERLSRDEPQLLKMAEEIKTNVGLFTDRILECRRERRSMAQL